MNRTHQTINQQLDALLAGAHGDNNVVQTSLSSSMDNSQGTADPSAREDEVKKGGGVFANGFQLYLFFGFESKCRK